MNDMDPNGNPAAHFRARTTLMHAITYLVLYGNRFPDRCAIDILSSALAVLNAELRPADRLRETKRRKSEEPHP